MPDDLPIAVPPLEEIEQDGEILKHYPGIDNAWGQPCVTFVGVDTAADGDIKGQLGVAFDLIMSEAFMTPEQAMEFSQVLVLAAAKAVDLNIKRKRAARGAQRD